MISSLEGLKKLLARPGGAGESGTQSLVLGTSLKPILQALQELKLSITKNPLWRQVAEYLKKLVNIDSDLLRQTKLLRKELDQKFLLQLLSNVAKWLFSPLTNLLKGAFSELLSALPFGHLLYRSARALIRRVPKPKIPFPAPVKSLGKGVLRFAGRALGKLGPVAAAAFAIPDLVEGTGRAREQGYNWFSSLSRGLTHAFLQTLSLGLLPKDLSLKISDAFNDFRDRLLGALWKGVTQLFENLFAPLKRGLSSLFESITKSIYDLTTQLLDKFKGVWQSLVDVVGKPLSNALDQVGQKLSDVKDTVVKAASPVTNVLGSAWGFLTEELQKRFSPKLPNPAAMESLKRVNPSLQKQLDVPSKLGIPQAAPGGGNLPVDPLSGVTLDAPIRLPDDFIKRYQQWKSSSDPREKAALQAQLQKNYPSISAQVFGKNAPQPSKVQTPSPVNAKTLQPSNLRSPTVTSNFQIRPDVTDILNRLYLSGKNPNLDQYNQEKAGFSQFQAYLARILPAGSSYPITQISRDNAGQLGYGPSGHLGTDIGIPRGTLLRAPISGHVILRETRGGWGKHVIITNGQSGILLGHLSQFDPYLVQRVQNKNPFVRQGDPIGLSGSTGNSTGPHLDVTVFRLLEERQGDKVQYRVQYLQSYRDMVATLQKADAGFDPDKSRAIAEKSKFYSPLVLSGTATPGAAELIDMPKLVETALNFSLDIPPNVNASKAVQPLKPKVTSPPKAPPVAPKPPPAAPEPVSEIKLTGYAEPVQPAVGTFQVNYEKNKGGLDFSSFLKQAGEGLLGWAQEKLSGSVSGNALLSQAVNLASDKAREFIRTGQVNLSFQDLSGLLQTSIGQLPFLSALPPELQGTVQRLLQDAAQQLTSGKELDLRAGAGQAITDTIKSLVQQAPLPEPVKAALSKVDWSQLIPPPPAPGSKPGETAPALPTSSSVTPPALPEAPVLGPIPTPEMPTSPTTETVAPPKLPDIPASESLIVPPKLPELSESNPVAPPDMPVLPDLTPITPPSLPDISDITKPSGAQMASPTFVPPLNSLENVGFNGPEVSDPNRFQMQAPKLDNTELKSSMIEMQKTGSSTAINVTNPNVNSRPASVSAIPVPMGGGSNIGGGSVRSSLDDLLILLNTVFRN